MEIIKEENSILWVTENRKFKYYTFRDFFPYNKDGEKRINCFGKTTVVILFRNKKNWEEVKYIFIGHGYDKFNTKGLSCYESDIIWTQPGKLPPRESLKFAVYFRKKSNEDLLKLIKDLEKIRYKTVFFVRNNIKII